MDEMKENYLRNTPISRNRTVRIEVVGDISIIEKHFLDGCAYFMAGTLSKDDMNHVKYVSDQMTKLIKYLVSEMRKKRTKDTGE